MNTILLAEDDATLRKNIALSLESEGYNVISASTAAEAEASANSAYHIILDVMLPY